MKFVAAAALFVTSAIAVPTGGGSDYYPCPDGLFSFPQCCATDALGLIGIDCQAPDKTPHDAHNFKAICADHGQQAKCCVLPLANQGVLCGNPVGV